MKNSEITEYDPETGPEYARQIREENDAWSADMGSRLRRVIKSRVGTQEKVAESLGVTVSTLQRYMKGDVALPFWAAHRVSRMSGVSLDWLATGEGGELGGAAKTSVNTGSNADQGQIQKQEGAPGAGLSDLEIERVREVGAMILELLAAEGVTLTRGAFGDLVRMALWLPDTETTRDLVVRMIRRLAAEP